MRQRIAPGRSGGMVDTADSKSAAVKQRGGSSPLSGTRYIFPSLDGNIYLVSCERRNLQGSFIVRSYVAARAAWWKAIIHERKRVLLSPANIQIPRLGSR